MKNLFLLSVLAILGVACENETGEEQSAVVNGTAEPEIATIIEENYDLRNDSIIFSSATIENFDQTGNSISVFWIGAARDTVLRFYRKYNDQQQLIGAEYYEPGDVEASRDTVYTNLEGLRVEAALNADNQITWKSTITTDENGNPVLKAYENGAGEYRGLDSLFFDNENRVVKGFYKNSRGERYGIKTYEYVDTDDNGNWTERMMYVDDELRQKQLRILTYHE